MSSPARPRIDETVIECRDLVVRYGDVVAVDRLSFTARAGQVVALLGPNGAGKTSTVETLEGYRTPVAGSVRVLGLDPRRHSTALVPRIGVMLQRGGVYPTMTPRQTVELFARYYDDPEDPAALLDTMGLLGVARTPWRRLSGGEQQRLSLALALVGRPEVLFLDEPTAGVDPEGRLTVRRVIAQHRQEGACVILTTHELPEVERLADEVIILSSGRVVASGSVGELGQQSEGIHFSAPDDLDLLALAAALGATPESARRVGPGRFTVTGDAGAARLAALASYFDAHGIPLGELRAGRGSLEDIYLALTAGEPVPSS